MQIGFIIYTEKLKTITDQANLINSLLKETNVLLRTRLAHIMLQFTLGTRCLGGHVNFPHVTAPRDRPTRPPHVSAYLTPLHRYPSTPLPPLTLPPTQPRDPCTTSSLDPLHSPLT